MILLITFKFHKSFIIFIGGKYDRIPGDDVAALENSQQ